MGLVCRRQFSGTSRFIFCDEIQNDVREPRVTALAFEALRHCAQVPEPRTSVSGFDLSPSTGVCVTVSKGLLHELTLDKPAFDFTPDLLSRKIARSLKLHGPAAAAVAACATGLASVKLGADWIRDGACDTVLAGAAESSSSELILNSFQRLGVLSKSGMTRPFDARSDGFVIGEGAAIFRLEKLGAPNALGHVLSVALGADAYHLTTPDPSGEESTNVALNAIKIGGVDEIGWVHVHGTGTAYNDRVEAAAVRKVFGKRIPPITATKGLTGHLLGASGAVALGITLESLRAGVTPFVCGTQEVAGEFRDLDLVLREPRKTNARTALVLNHGFGGHLAAAVVSVYI